MRRRSLYKSLKHPISFLLKQNQDAYETENWILTQRSFAEITPLFDNKVGSLENFDFGHIVTEGYFIFKIRALKGLNVDMRIQFEDRLFQIKRIIDLCEAKQIMKIITLEIL